MIFIYIQQCIIKSSNLILNVYLIINKIYLLFIGRHKWPVETGLAIVT